MTKKSIFMVFAPQFLHFGCDIAREYLKRSGGGKVHGICMGSERIRAQVIAELAELAGEIEWISDKEMEWLAAPVSQQELEDLEKNLGTGMFGRIVTSDRRVGRGFVRGGLCRPDHLGLKAVENPGSVPQRYVFGLYHHVCGMLDRIKPDMVFCYAVASAPALLLAELSCTRNIPVLRFSLSRIKSGYIIDDDPIGMLAPITRRFKEAIEGRIPIPEPFLAEARDFLKQFRETPITPEYVQRFFALQKAQTPLKYTIQSLASIMRHFLKWHMKAENLIPEISRKLFAVRSIWRRKYPDRTWFSADVQTGCKFIYYPLHVNPEASTMVRTPWHTDQIAVIEALAKAAPAHLQVVVKEHAPMIGRRPRDFYRQIAQMPRVTLIGPEHSGMEVARRAELTVVISGTAAWEATLMKKPALVIGESARLAFEGGVVYEPCLAQMSQAIVRALAVEPVKDETITLYIAATLAESFEMPSAVLWGDYSKVPPEKKIKYVGSTVDWICARMAVAQSVTQ